MKNKHDALPLTKEQVYGEYEAAMLKVALLEAQEQETDSLEQALERQRGTAEGEKLEALVRGNQARMSAVIQRELKHSNWQHFTKHSLLRLVKIAACLLLLFFIGLTIAVASVQPVRDFVLEFVFDMQPEQQHARMVKEEEEDAAVQAVWQGEYFPTYIPDGFGFGEISSAAGIDSILYTAEDDSWLEFQECIADSSASIETANAIITHTQVNGKTGVVAQKEGQTTISWSQFSRFFIISTDLDVQQALQIADSVERVQ